MAAAVTIVEWPPAIHGLNKVLSLRIMAVASRELNSKVMHAADTCLTRAPALSVLLSTYGVS